MHQAYYPKRSYTFHTLKNDLKRLFSRRAIIKRAMKQSLNRRFIEHIMLACTAVNGCRYCAWGHALVTTKLGDDIELITQILNLNLEQVPEYERPALEFAIHYAETHGNYAPKAYHQLVTFYGKEKAQDILTVILMINFGNLLGNTVDAFESRLKKRPPENGDFCLEFTIYLLGGFFFKQIMERNKLYQALLKQQVLKTP